MFKFWKKKTKIEPEVRVFDAFADVGFMMSERKALIETLIKMYLKDYHLHKSPPKGVKRIPKIKVTD